MFSHDTAETEKGCIELDGIEPDIGKQCIDYIYTGKARFSLKDPEKLIYAAELMEIPSLTDMYLGFLRQELGIEKCLEYVQLAETHKHRSFAEFFQKNFTPEEFEFVVNSNSFVKFTQLLMEQVLEAVAQCKVNLETLKWAAVLKWIKADESRKSTFAHLFDLINLRNLPEEFIKEQISKEQLVRDSGRCLKKIFNVLSSAKPAEEPRQHTVHTGIIAYHNTSQLLIHYDVELKMSSRLSRIPTELKGGFDFVCKNGEVFVGNGNLLMKFSDDEWTKIWEATKGHLYYCRCAVVEDVVYMVTSSFVIEFNIETEISKRIEEKLGFPDGFAIAASSTHLYAIGGGSDYKLAKEFDIRSKTWEPIASMPRERRQVGAVFSQGKLIAIGGKYQHVVQETNPSWNACSRIDQFGYHRDIYGNQINQYVSVTKQSYTCNVDCYNPHSDRWRVYPSIQCSNSNFKALVVKDKIYIVGGDKSSDGSPSLELLDFKL